MNLVFLDPDTPYPKIVETRSAGSLRPVLMKTKQYLSQRAIALLALQE